MKQYDCVKLTKDIPDGGEVFVKGTVGTIVEIWTKIGVPNGYEVELFNQHKTIGLVTLQESDIELNKMEIQTT